MESEPPTETAQIGESDVKDCSICKYCYEDYIFDEETGNEHPIYDCEKGNDTDLDFECKDFKEYKPKKYVEKDTECDTCEFKERCGKLSSGLDCTCTGDTKTHVVYPKDKCIKAHYDVTDFDNALKNRMIDADEWFRLANAPTDEEIESLKKAKEMGVEIPENIANYFSEYGIEV